MFNLPKVIHQNQVELKASAEYIMNKFIRKANKG